MQTFVNGANTGGENPSLDSIFFLCEGVALASALAISV